MKVIIDYKKCCDDVIGILTKQLPEYLTHFNATQPKTLKIGADYADVSVKKPAVLVYPDYSTDDSEEQGIVETVCHVAIGVFINGTNSTQVFYDVLAYASAIKSIFTNIQETEYIWQILSSGDTDFTSRGTSNEKVFVTWVDCHVRTQIEE